ncbi:MAG: hypothetical protein JWP36_2617 [Paucimonas sp.]|nr:hypothetical protein [Paucimonas sp.]
MANRAENARHRAQAPVAAQGQGRRGFHPTGNRNDLDNVVDLRRVHTLTRQRASGEAGAIIDRLALDREHGPDSDSRISSDSESSDPERSEVGVYQLSEATRKKLADAIRIAAQREQATAFGSLEQVLTTALSGLPIFTTAILLPMLCNKGFETPYCLLASGVLVVLAMPLAKNAAVGGFDFEVAKKVNKQVKLHARVLRDWASGKTRYPLDRHGNSTDPRRELDTRELLANFFRKMPVDDLVYTAFGFAFAIKNVAPTLAGNTAFYDHKLPGGLRNDMAIHGALGATIAMLVPLAGQGLRWLANPGGWKRKPDRETLDARIPALDALKKELEIVRTAWEASGTDLSVAQVIEYGGGKASLLSLLAATDKELSTATQDRAQAAGQLRADYAALFTSRIANSVATALGMTILMVCVIMTNIETSATAKEDPTLVNRLKAEVLPSLVFGTLLIFRNDLPNLTRILLAPFMGLFDHDVPRAATLPELQQALAEGGQAGDLIEQTSFRVSRSASSTSDDQDASTEVVISTEESDSDTDSVVSTESDGETGW